MPFLEIDILSGIFSIIVIAIYVYVGLRIIFKYFEVKQRVFLLVGITWIGLSEPWWGSALSFLIGLTNDGVGLQFGGEPTYFLVGNLFIPLTLVVWMLAFTDLLYKESQKKILAVFIIYAVAFEIIFLFLNFTTPEAVGSLASATDVTYKSLVMVFLLSLIVVIMVTGTLFARESIRSDNPEIKLKGKLLRLAFILFSVGAALDSAIPFDKMPFLLPVTRIIMILSAVFFYGGFMLPNWMKKMFLKEG